MAKAPVLDPTPALPVLAEYCEGIERVMEARGIRLLLAALQGAVITETSFE